MVLAENRGAEEEKPAVLEEKKSVPLATIKSGGVL